MELRRRHYGEGLLPLIPFAAPAAFDANAQTVNIHKIYSEYSNIDKAYGYSFSDSINTLTLSAGAGISYRYGYTRGGVDYAFDVTSATNPFTATIDTKRWVIVNSSLNIAPSLPNGAIWAYFGAKSTTISSITAGASSLKYMHSELISGLFSTLPSAFQSSGLAGGIIIPISFTIISSYSFFGCQFLTENLTINSKNLTIGFNPFGNTYLILNNQIGDNWEIYDKVLYKDITRSNIIGSSRNKTGTLIIQPSVISIGPEAFAFCTGLTGGINFPISVATISSNSFTTCTGLTSISIENTSPTINTTSFVGCSNVTSINIPPDYHPANSGGNYYIAFSNNLTAASLNQYILNVRSGVVNINMGATNKARLLAAYPTAETDANARGITIV